MLLATKSAIPAVLVAALVAVPVVTVHAAVCMRAGCGSPVGSHLKE